MMLLILPLQCKAQENQDKNERTENASKNSAQKAAVEAKDTVPKGKIGLKPFDGGKYNYLFVFYDENGKAFKEITDRDLPAFSTFKSLNFPKIYEEHGEVIKNGITKYNLRDVTFEKRIEVLRKADVTGVPDSVVRRATDITYFGNSLKFNAGDRYIITTELSRFYDEAPKNQVYTCWDQTHISIFDSRGTVVRQLDINHAVSDALISDDGRYLLTIFNIYHRDDADTYDIPFQILDLITNEVNRIDFSKEYHSIMPVKLIFADSFFQLILGAGPNMIHTLINPFEKKIYLKKYKEKQFAFLGNDYQFKSMHLPDGKKINLDTYETLKY